MVNSCNLCGIVKSYRTEDGQACAYENLDHGEVNQRGERKDFLELLLKAGHGPCCNCTSRRDNWSRDEYFAKACPQCVRREDTKPMKLHYEVPSYLDAWLERVVADYKKQADAASRQALSEESDDTPHIVFIENAQCCSTFSRRALAIEYGITSIAFVAELGGVVEYGLCDHTTWDDERRSIEVPGEEVVKAMTSGSHFAIFWKRENDMFVAAAGYVQPECEDALRHQRGDDKTFVSESRCVALSASGDNAVAVAAKLGREMEIANPGDCASFQRAELAREFCVGNVKFVPHKDGVLECGTKTCITPATSPLRTPSSTAGAKLPGLTGGCEILTGDTSSPSANPTTTALGEPNYYPRQRPPTGPAAGPMSPRPASKCASMGNETSEGRDWSSFARSHYPRNFMTPLHISAVLQMRCEASGSAYAIFWQEDGERLVVGGDYVTPARRAALSALGKHTTYAEASRTVVLDAAGDSPVAHALKRRPSGHLGGASGHGRRMVHDDPHKVLLAEHPEAYTPPLTPPSSPRHAARGRAETHAQSQRGSTVGAPQARRRSADSWLERAMHRMASHELESEHASRPRQRQEEEQKASAAEGSKRTTKVFLSRLMSKITTGNSFPLGRGKSK